MAQRNISAAKTAKKDEFYTQLEDIDNKLKHYREHFIDTAQFNLKTDTTMKKKLLTAILCMITTITNAQIGYQISLLNTATGEARANETVRVEIKLSNNEGEVFYSETKSATTNDFGVLSLSIGNADTFKDVDFTKMPFFIEASANGVAIGKSQILSAPVAEYAKRTGSLTKELLVGTWVSNYSCHWTQNAEYSTKNSDGETIKHPYTYTVFGEHRMMYTFNADGSGSYVNTYKSWVEGYKGGDQIIDMTKQTTDERNESYDFTYRIIGDDVYRTKDVSDEDLAKNFPFFYKRSHGPITITDISSNYSKESLGLLLHYTPSLNQLGGLTKIK